MSCLDVTNKHSWDTNWHFGARQHWLFIFCVENIYPSGFKVLSSLGSMCSNKKVQLSLWKSGRGKTVFTSDILLKEQREPLKEGSSAIHPPLWGHCLTEVTLSTKFSYPSFLRPKPGSDSSPAWPSSVPPPGGTRPGLFAHTDSSGGRFPSSVPKAHSNGHSQSQCFSKGDFCLSKRP